jgi:hypothetical protein
MGGNDMCDKKSCTECTYSQPCKNDDGYDCINPDVSGITFAVEHPDFETFFPTICGGYQPITKCEGCKLTSCNFQYGQCSGLK